MNLGKYDHLIDANRYRYPRLFREEKQTINVDDLQKRFEPFTALETPGVTVFERGNIEILFNGVVTKSKVELSLDHNDTYEIYFMNGDEITAVRTRKPLTAEWAHGLEISVEELTKSEAKKGYNKIIIAPCFPDELPHVVQYPTNYYGGDEFFALGHVILR